MGIIKRNGIYKKLTKWILEYKNTTKKWGKKITKRAQQQIWEGRREKLKLEDRSIDIHF